MARAEVRLGVVQAGLVLALAAIVGRAAYVQVWQGATYAREAAKDRTEHLILPARRGTIRDRNGVPLAVTQEYYHVGVAPNELADRDAAVRQLSRALGINTSRLRADLRGPRRWLYYYGPFSAAQVDPVRSLHGVHLDREYARFYPARGLARPIIGALASDSARGASGLELVLDSVLRGEPGAAVVIKDRAGRTYDSPSRQVRDPVAGGDVLLTIDAELQDIAEQGLAEALQALHAEGGDVVFLDPRTGEVLALASRQSAASGDAGVRPSTITDPFEPGSTAKLFTAAALLADRLVDSTATVSGHDGHWLMPINSRGETRPIDDVHPLHGRVTLAEAIGVSSNIAMAQFSSRLTDDQQYDMLRNFGFGSPTGIEFPAESRGRLTRPDQWTSLSRASHAMGYEMGVTPLQLAAAYAAIADDGVLLTPTLVKEIRGPDGRILYQHRPEPVRRAVSPEVAARLRAFMRGAVAEGGTGERAQLANYQLIGKTGTAKHFENGVYVQGEYVASFAALFPADDPQLVVIVKLDAPRGEFGGATAAPVTRTMLEQALASRRVAIDRSRLTERLASSLPVAAAPDPTDPDPSMVVIPWPPVPDSAASTPVTVPAVIGSTVRQASLALHRRGFRVDLRGLGLVERTDPGAGASAPRGTTITVWTR
ncbi:MAG TPA: penicillin-binding transpeptidase domain-containing protein [Gemmatimonadales bacterium]|nr:penicillin-binding transpeptidase domain-containing protein [Gemmatimonadales bacterium]